jgi:SAM-dependent methyltransferase
MAKAEDIPHSRIQAIRFFENYVSKNSELIKGKRVLDLSAGSGYIASLFEKAGADVKTFDLFPDQNKFTQRPSEFIDLQEKLNLSNQCADIVLCSETIECIPNQVFLFSEFSRILNQGGTLILTTANPSSLRGRFSQFVMEGEHYSNAIPHEHNAFAKWPGSQTGYYSKLFISGVLRIRTMAAIHGLKIRKIHRSARSSTAYFLFFIFYPIIRFFSRKNLRKSLKTDPKHSETHMEI